VKQTVSPQEKNMELPEWEVASEKQRIGTANPLEVFIANNEPAGIVDEQEFRLELEAMLEYVSGLTQRAGDGAESVCPECGAKLNYCTECEKRVMPRA
jgi:hypothetical protein